MKMRHVTINTSFFEEEIEFYRSVAELKVQREMHDPGRDIVFLANSEGEAEIEIIKTPEALCSGTEYISIGFHVEDVEKKREELAVKGFDPTPIRDVGGGTRFFFVKDPAGVRVQFI